MFDGMMTGRVEHVWGRAALRPQLCVRQNARMRGGSHFRVVSLFTTVQVALPDRNKNPQDAVYVGRAYPESWLSTVVKDGDFSWDFTVDLDERLIAAVEEYRKAKDIFVQIKTQVVGFEQPTQAITGRVDADTIKNEHNQSSDYCSLHIAKSRWLEILGELRYGEFYSAEIPLPRIRQQKPLERPLARLQRAWEHLLDGNDKETLGACYDALEALAKNLNKKLPDQMAYAAMLGEAASEKREVLKLTFDYITKFLNLGRHEHTKPVEIDHRDAELAFVLAHACLAYLSKLKLKQGREESH